MSRLPRWAPLVLPTGWHLEPFGPDGIKLCRGGPPPSDYVSVIVTRAELAGREWIHASMARPDRTPTWEELAEMKAWLIGRDRYAYQVLPPAAMHVNIHQHALHLFAVVDGPEPLPDFTMGTGSL